DEVEAAAGNPSGIVRAGHHVRHGVGQPGLPGVDFHPDLGVFHGDMDLVGASRVPGPGMAERIRREFGGDQFGSFHYLVRDEGVRVAPQACGDECAGFSHAVRATGEGRGGYVHPATAPSVEVAERRRSVRWCACGDSDTWQATLTIASPIMCSGGARRPRAVFGWGPGIAVV